MLLFFFLKNLLSQQFFEINRSNIARVCKEGGQKKKIHFLGMEVAYKMNSQWHIMFGSPEVKFPLKFWMETYTVKC